MKSKPRSVGRPRLVPEDAQSFQLRLPPELLVELRGFTVVKSEDPEHPMSLNTLLWTTLTDWVKSQPANERTAARRAGRKLLEDSVGDGRRRS